MINGTASCSCAQRKSKYKYIKNPFTGKVKGTYKNNIYLQYDQLLVIWKLSSCTNRRQVS